MSALGRLQFWLQFTPGQCCPLTFSDGPDLRPPRVRGSSPWRRTRPDLGFLSSLYLVGDRFRAMVAPRLLVSPEIVDHGGRTPVRPLPMVIRSVTSDEKAQVAGAAPWSGRVSRWPMVSAR